jgi:hypothetical protein
MSIQLRERRSSNTPCCSGSCWARWSGSSAPSPLGPRPLARAANAVLTALGNGGKASAELSSQTRTNSGLDTDDRRNSSRFWAASRARDGLGRTAAGSGSLPDQAGDKIGPSPGRLPGPLRVRSRLSLVSSTILLRLGRLAVKRIFGFSWPKGKPTVPTSTKSPMRNRPRKLR